MRRDIEGFVGRTLRVAAQHDGAERITCREQRHTSYSLPSPGPSKTTDTEAPDELVVGELKTTLRQQPAMLAGESPTHARHTVTLRQSRSLCRVAARYREHGDFRPMARLAPQLVSG